MFVVCQETRCNKVGSRIFKIDGEMSEIMEPKVDNPKIQSAEIEPYCASPKILPFLEDKIYQLFSCLYGSKVAK